MNTRLAKGHSTTTQRLCSYPEEASVIAPVPSCGIEHVWGQDTVDNADDVAVDAVSQFTPVHSHRTASSYGSHGRAIPMGDILAVAAQHDGLDLQATR